MNMEKVLIIVTFMYCHECSHTDQYNRLLSEMLCIATVIFATKKGDGIFI